MSRPLRLRVDWSRCDGHGLCEHWAPELIGRDEWGFPVVDAGSVPAQALEHARAAVAACPVLALKLLPASNPS